MTVTIDDKTGEVKISNKEIMIMYDLKDMPIEEMIQDAIDTNLFTVYNQYNKRKEV
jgi:hypothetical protein